MSIQFDAQTKTFRLETLKTSYVMGISEYGHLLHLYFGKKIGNDDIRVLFAGKIKTGFCPVPNGCDKKYSLNTLPQEFSSDGVGDFRYPSITVVNSDGSTSEIYGTCLKENGVTYVSQSALLQALDLYLAE